MGIAAGLGLLVDQGRVLLLRREGPPFQGLWSVPGGRAGKGEHLQRAAEREVEAALGWRLAARGLCALSLERREYEEDGQPPESWLLATFAFAAPPGEPPPSGAAWFPVGDLTEIDMVPTDRMRIADALAAAPPPAPVACRRATIRVGADGRPRVTFYG